MPWYTTADARRDAEKQSASKNRENSVRDNEGPSMNDMEREYRQLCRIDETPGVRGLAQLGRNAIERVAQLEKELAAAVAERDRFAIQRDQARLTIREIAQILIDQIGSVGPENAINAALRACEVIESMATRLAALAELEKAAADPVAWMYDKGDEEGLVTPFNPLTTPGHGGRKNIRPLYAAPPPPVAEIREVVYAAAEMSSRVANSYFGIDTPANMSDMLEVLRYWRRELGPMLGLVELREPTEAECDAIYFAACNDPNGQTAHEGREMFNAVRAVMFPQKSEVGL